ncbi:MAG: hypothetical protein NWF05_11980 [Candidatus Bathyarchaeota archaeon]|nr:hypothetical protein [Candidatus Bathyarchaeota archaeon]
MKNELCVVLSESPPVISKPTENSARAGVFNRKRLVLLAILAVVVVILVTAVLLFPRNSVNSVVPAVLPDDANNSIPLGLNYTVGEKMVYTSSSIVTSELDDSTISGAFSGTQSYNSTLTTQVLSFNGETYTISQSSVSEESTFPSLKMDVSKSRFYSNFMVPISVFTNLNSNPALSALLATTEVKAGDVWQIPVNTGNSTLGLTGNLNLTFVGVQYLTVDTGTYGVFRIDFQSDNITMHMNLEQDPIGVSALDGSITQISGQTYLEYGTCRLIKAENRQDIIVPSGGTATMVTQRTLVEHTLT